METPLPLTIENKISTNKDSMINNIKQICKDILEKYLDGRKLVMEKKEISRIWIWNIFYISDKTAYTCSSTGIFYLDTDINLTQKFNTNDFYSYIRIFANKKIFNKRKFFTKYISKRHNEDK